jgi:hypothetical protein
MKSRQLNAALVSGVIKRIALLGRQQGLAPLDWLTLEVDGSPLIEGAPFSEVGGAELCERWAAALGMREYSFSASDDDGVRSWYLGEAAVTIEVSTLRHAYQGEARSTHPVGRAGQRRSFWG